MVPPTSDQVSRVWPYSGSCAASVVFPYMALTFFGVLSHTLQVTTRVLQAVRNPESISTVSVQAVPHVNLWIQFTLRGHDSAWVSPFRNLRIEGCLHLPAAYRSLPRLSSAPSAKAFALRPS